MKHVKKSVLLWYSAQEIYDLVVDVEDYPKFLPWCERAEVLARDDQGLTARLHLAFSGIRHAFTTRNIQVKDESVDIALVDGPFSELDGLWRFIPLPVPGAVANPGSASACKIEFDLRYAFANGMLEAAISPVFDRIANTFVDSFVRRAEQVYGPR
ncbi:MAG: type II toxin-antitoxin system RatA family toxin [Burkholderiales bacterium]|nr:type II toxin-antitoxin system RatA family toxin [Burkholderiales bacterium]